MNDDSIICETAHDVVGSSAAIPPPAPPQPASKPPMANKDKKKSAIRHAEKRRTSTCRFADRVAQLSVDHYNATIPIEQRPPQTCIATILAHYRKHEDDVHKHDDNDGAAGMLWILSMGVGTKFLSESCLRQEVENEKEDGYGSRVRDMHAEVLARRAFRRQVTLEIQEDLRVLEEETAKRSLACSETNTVSFSAFGNRNNNNDEQQGVNMSILVRSNKDSTIRYMLRPGVTLHMYTSSAPCGNATLKKFCKMAKERFRDDLGPDEWPNAPHEPPSGSSIKLGEFSLLVKKDNNDTISSKPNSNNSNDAIASIDNNPSSDGGNRKNGNEPTNMAVVPQSPSTMDPDNNMDLVKTKKRTRNEEKGSSSEQTKTTHEIKSLQQHKPPTRRAKAWPATLSDDWAPPGTTIVGFQQKGSIHTCSDKICRWNYLGLQGSLLAGILEEPLYLSTLTVGRKLSGSVCRRAICCRLDTRCRQPRLPKSSEKNISASTSSNDDQNVNENKYRVNHPAVMGTSVKLDTGVVDTSNADERGQDVRFHSSVVWSWWPGPHESGNNSKPCTKSTTSDNGVLECIESSSGFLAQLLDDTLHNHNADTGQSLSVAPKVSTKELTSLFLQVYHQAAAARTKSTDPSCDASSSKNINNNNSDDEMGQKQYQPNLWYNNSLSGIRVIKKLYSPMHETFKDLLLTEHKVLSQWRRREDRNKCKNCIDST